MKKPWPIVKLVDVLKHRKESVVIDDTKEYLRCRVQIHAQGIVLRDCLPGALIKTKQQQVCKAGEFLVAEIDAKVGGYGIVPQELDGAIVSSHYFLFEIDESILHHQFLDYFVRTPSFFQQVQAQGSTNYAAIRPSHVLNYQIPLPPLSEQRRIVKIIDSIAQKIQEAKNLRQHILKETEAIFNSACDSAFHPKDHWKAAKVADFCKQPQYGYTESATTEPVGPKFLRITDIQNGKVSWDTVPYCPCHQPDKYLLRPGDILFARTGATTGKSFLIRDCPQAVFASYLIRLRVQATLSADYLYKYFQSPQYWTQVFAEKKGTGQPNLNGKKLSNIRVPVPPIPEQRRIVTYLDDLQAKVNKVKDLQRQTSAELDALLPSILDKAFKGNL